MKVLVFGDGYLGRRIATAVGGLTTRTRIDDRVAVARVLEEGFDAVVNAAGKTGKPNVDWCERYPAETMISNTIGPLVLAEECAKAGTYLLHIGSGCIFYGPSPSPGGWREDDYANPKSFYSRSKYAADLLLSEIPNVGIARIRMPIGRVAHPRNLITKLVGYRQVIDVENSVTVVEDFLDVVRRLVELCATGVFHVTNPGTMRHRDLLDLYKKWCDPAHKVEIVPENYLETNGIVVATRSNCVLASTRLEGLGITMRPIGEALNSVMEHYG